MNKLLPAHRDINDSEPETAPLASPLRFSETRAYLIGVADYTAPHWKLKTPVNDVHAIGAFLSNHCNFHTEIIENPGKKKIEALLSHIAAEGCGEDTPVLIYFAGHGTADESREGIKGYLIPADAEPGNRDTYIDMADVAAALASMPCRHLLLVLDCCFGGSFRWAEKTNNLTLGVNDHAFRLTKSHYDYFTQKRAIQVLTSCAPNQKALDFIRIGDHEGTNSPFATLFLSGLVHADVNQDKIITVAELYNYLQDTLSKGAFHKNAVMNQNVGLFPMNGHENGEFLFCECGFEPQNLQSAGQENPFRGLNSYEAGDAGLFFGRKKATEELREKILSLNTPLLVVSGASGTGKSSLVKAGLLPAITQRPEGIPIIKPGRHPYKELEPHRHQPVLVLDQFEQIVTQADEQEVPAFWQLLEERIADGHITIVTVRIDFEGQLKMPATIRGHWDQGLYRVPPFSAAQLREIIVTPTHRYGYFIEPASLVDTIIHEVVHYPGSMPLLSFTMRQLVEHCDKNDVYRRISAASYERLGGVIGSLQQSADAVYASFSEEQKTAMKAIMLRMVALAGGETAGKRVLRTSLDFGDAVFDVCMQQVISVLENEHRLLHSGTDGNGDRYLEPAHDALVRSWNKVQEWIKELGRENLLVCDQLAEAAYERQRKVNAALWSDDPRTEICHQLHQAGKFRFTQQEVQFLEAGEHLRRRRMEELQNERDRAVASEKVAQDEKQKAERAAQESVRQEMLAKKSEKKAIQRRNIARAVAAIAAVLALIAYLFKHAADDQRARADEEKIIAQRNLHTAIQNRIEGEAVKVEQGLIDVEIFLQAGKDSLAVNKLRFLEEVLLNVRRDFSKNLSSIDTSGAYRRAWESIQHKKKEMPSIAN